MKRKPSRFIDLNDFTPEQIEQLQALIYEFQQQNKPETIELTQRKKYESDSLDDLFFASEIRMDFQRSKLYGHRS